MWEPAAPETTLRQIRPARNTCGYKFCASHRLQRSAIEPAAPAFVPVAVSDFDSLGWRDIIAINTTVLLMADLLKNSLSRNCTTVPFSNRAPSPC